MYLSPEKEPTGEDIDGAGIDDAHPDKENEIFWAARQHFPANQQAVSCQEYLKLNIVFK